MDKKEMRNLFDGDCSPAEEQAAGRWLAEHAETKEADELLYALLRETKPATANAEGAFRRVCRRLGMAQRPGEWFEAYAPYGKTLRVVLPDGSEVVINSGSKLIYPDRFGPDRRQVFLAGEGYATIAKDPGRPFVMSAGEVDVRVLGTKFNLKSYAEDSEVEVTLVEGSVEMETKLGGDDRIVRLRPGELVKLDKRTGSTETFDVPTDTYRPVVCGGGLFFMDKRFDEIVAYLEKRFDVKINVADRALAERRFIASFVNGESLDEMLASFNADEAMRIRREGRIVNITKR